MAFYFCAGEKRGLASDPSQESHPLEHSVDVVWGESLLVPQLADVVVLDGVRLGAALPSMLLKVPKVVSRPCSENTSLASFVKGLGTLGGEARAILRYGEHHGIGMRKRTTLRAQRRDI